MIEIIGEIDHFLFAKKWSDMTEKEIIEHKKKQCVNCEYLSSENIKDRLPAMTCDYLLIVGHRRGCSPLDCMIYGAFKPRKNGKKARRC